MMLRSLTPILAAAAMVTLALQPAMAQERGSRASQLMRLLDLDADGNVSLDEIGGENKPRLGAVERRKRSGFSPSL